jgi:hypothetical protein
VATNLLPTGDPAQTVQLSGAQGVTTPDLGRWAHGSLSAALNNPTGNRLMPGTTIRARARARALTTGTSACSISLARATQVAARTTPFLSTTNFQPSLSWRTHEVYFDVPSSGAGISTSDRLFVIVDNVAVGAAPAVAWDAVEFEVCDRLN